jgi:hypothetical protein
VKIPLTCKEIISKYYNNCKAYLDRGRPSQMKRELLEHTYKNALAEINDFIEQEKQFRQQFLQIDLFDFKVQESIFEQLITVYSRPDLWMKRILHEANNDDLVTPITIEAVGSVFVDTLKSLLVATWDEETYKKMERMQSLVPLLVEGNEQFFISHAPLFHCLNQIAEEGYHERPIYKKLKPMLNCCIKLMSKLNRLLPDQFVKTHENMIFKKCGKNIVHWYARKGFDNKGLKLVVDRMKRSPLQLLSILLQKEEAPSQFLHEGYTPFDLAGKYAWVYDLALRYTWDKGAGERNENVCTAFQIMKEGLQECIKFQQKSDLILPRKFEKQIHKAKKLLQSFSHEMV